MKTFGRMEEGMSCHARELYILWRRVCVQMEGPENEMKTKVKIHLVLKTNFHLIF